MVSFLHIAQAKLHRNARRAAFGFAAVSVTAFLLLVITRSSTGSYLPSLWRSVLVIPEPDSTREELNADSLPDSIVFPDQMLFDTTDVSGTSEYDTLETSLSLDDTSHVVFQDSTARLKYFQYVRRDQRQVELFPDRTYPVYASPKPPTYRRAVTIDSVSNMVQIRETVGGHDVKIPISLPLKEYIALRRKHDLWKLFADEARRPKRQQQRDDLSELFTNITQIQIPIPANPILSIFGKPEIKLNISGAVDIKAGFRNTKNDQTQLSRFDQSRNEPDFSQEVQVNVNGTIGDKLNILADWNTQRTFEYENQLKIRYTGYDDEIVQSVEAGNVSLQTPSSFIGSSQALFGLKAKFQTGPLTLTTLASQKKGQIREVSVSGGAQESPFEIRAYNYSTNHFFVDTNYISLYESYYQSDPPVVNPDAQIVEEEVWVQLLGVDPNQTAVARQGIAYIDLPERPVAGYDSTLRSRPESAGRVEVGRFVRLERAQYELAGEGYLGVLSLNTSVSDNQIVAIAYRRADGRQFGELSRNLPSDTSRVLVLKMVKPRNLNSSGPGYRVAWRMMLKNIYSVGGRNIKKAGFALNILRRVPGAEDQNSILGEPLLRVLGLDNYNADDTRNADGDGEFDFRPGRTVSQPRAEIIFPWLRPFDDGIRNYFISRGLTVPDSTFFFPEVYDTTKTFSQQSERDRYIIKGKATGEATSKYPLGFNVVEGSVQVLLDGRPLTPNVDYTVDYIVGEVVIRNDRALVPGANLQIKYEQNDLFQLASKTLLGARGDLSLSQRTKLGFTLMSLNQQTLSDKVRLGEEPNRNTILGFDGSTDVDLPFLTSAINSLPLLQTREPSQLRISGEAAYMLPDPNTKKSTIPSDEGQGIAYIDDFEGARRTIPIGINYAQWTQASPPVDEESNRTLGVDDTTKMFSKGRMVWFNRLPTDVRLTDVYPRKLPGNAANNIVTVLDFRYFPSKRGQFNYSRDLANTLTPLRNWGGVMKPISISATNLINENINFIEIWMQVTRRPLDANAKMVIDIGTISEDAIPNRALNTEDLVPPSTTINGTLQQWEDVGLDMLTNAQEQTLYQGLIALYPELASDPSGDDYAFDNNNVGTPQEDYSRINGTENSKLSPSGLIPDTEDLNFNGIVDLGNSYFQYEIPLDTVNNPLIVGGGANGWYQFRIPIRDTTRTVGSPNFENVEYIRVFFRNATDTIAVRIADFALVGNQWQELRKEDTTFAVSVVSIEDNPDYESPPGVIRERDRTRPDENVQANEQSLALLLRGIPDGQSRQAVKFYTFRPLDLFNYRTMKMFVYGDPNFEYIDVNNYDAEIFFRFGLDSLNFYEYRAPIRKGWDPLNDIVINFSELTAIKQDRDSINIISDPKPVENGPPGSVYRVLGNPSLTQVRYLAIGVTNPADKGVPGRPLVGEVWVNELRLTSVDDAPGWAYRVDTQVKLADIGTVAFNYSKIDPNFHALEQRFGSRQTGTNWGLSASMQLEKFFPTSWTGTSFPFSYSHTEGLVQPKYLPNSDILVSEAADRTRARELERGGTEAEANQAASAVITQSETFRVTDTYAAPTFRIMLPSREWYIRDTFNRLTFGFTYTKSRERSPAIERRLSWHWNARISYSVNLPTDYFITPFKSLFDGVWLLETYKDMKIYYAPTNFSWSLSATRSRDVSLQRAIGSQEVISRNFIASRQMGFGWRLTEGGLLNLSGDYGLNIESSLLDLELDPQKRQRPFSQILGDIFFGDKLINFGNDTRYTQRNQFNTRPNIPNIFDLKKYLDVTFSYGVDYSWQNQLLQGDIGKSAGWNNNISFSLNFRLKQLFDPLFAEKPASQPQAGGRGRREVPTEEDELKASETESDTTVTEKKSGLDKTLDQFKNLLRVLIKIPFLDYDNVNVTFTQNNNVQNSGVVGRPGFVNFWGRVPFFQEADPRHGPSRLYQLGLISDPHGRLTNFGFRDHFPFFGWDVEPGIRARGGVLINTFRQTNRLAFKTSRSLWPGARLDLNWNVGWTFNRTQNLTADSLSSLPRINNTTTTGSVDRSFLTFPDFLFLGIFKSNLKEVSKRFAQLKADRDTTRTDDEKLAQAFEEGLEAFPFLRKLFGQFYPRVNWSFRWDGLEKLSMFEGFVSRLSLDHSYTSTYTRQFRNQPGGGGERTDGQRVTYGFTPLVGLNFTFKDLFKGNFGANLRYTTTTSYDLATSSRNLIETLTQEISITASFSRRGFEIPLFGLALNNDLDVSATYSRTRNSRQTYDISKLDILLQGTPLEGSTRTVIEPRIKYVLSSRVTASIYYRYTNISPDASGSRVPGSTVNEAGLDIHIAIQ